MTAQEARLKVEESKHAQETRVQTHNYDYVMREINRAVKNQRKECYVTYLTLKSKHKLLNDGYLVLDEAFGMRKIGW